jgi:hypothetical protein
MLEAEAPKGAAPDPFEEKVQEQTEPVAAEQ